MKQTVSTIFGEVPLAQETKWGLVEEYFQPIQALYQDESVTDIMVNRFDDISIDKNGQLEKTEAAFESESELHTFIEQIASALGQTINSDNPILDARLPDCSRLVCTLPTASPMGATVTLRVVSKKALTAQDLVEKGAMTQEMLDFLIQHIVIGSNFIISGNTGSGKTSLIRALSHYIPKGERVVICEDTLELYLSWLPFSVSLEAPKRKNSDIKMKNLIQASLRMRPDLILVGEIRHAESADAFLQAINTGHKSMTTLHANSGVDAITRIQYLVASAGLISYELAAKQIYGAVDVLVHVSRHPDYGRKVTEISIIKDDQVVPVFTYDTTLGRHIKH